MPRVVVLADASSSMGEDLGGVLRWDALREALLAGEGNKHSAGVSSGGARPSSI